jgi:hypothetical protein
MDDYQCKYSPQKLVTEVAMPLKRRNIICAKADADQCHSSDKKKDRKGGINRRVLQNMGDGLISPCHVVEKKTQKP